MTSYVHLYDELCTFTWRATYIYMTSYVHLYDELCTFIWRAMYIYMTSYVHLYDELCIFTWRATYIYMTSYVHLYDELCTFIWRAMYIYMMSYVHLYLAKLFLKCEMLQSKALDRIKTNILCSVTFRRNSCGLWDDVEKYNRARQVIDDSTEHALCMLDK